MSGWVTPTGTDGTGGGWSFPGFAIDGNPDATFAYVANPFELTETDPLVVTISPTWCNNIRIKPTWVDDAGFAINVDAYYEDAWHNVYFGSGMDGYAWNEYAIPLNQVTAVRVAFTYLGSGAAEGGIQVFEVELYQVVPTPPGYANCVGLWRMNEASWAGDADEVIDSSGHNNHGVRVGDATTAEGKIGRCGTFGGAGSVNLGTPADLDFDGSSPFTFCFLINTSSLTAGRRIYHKRSGTRGFEIHMHDSGGIRCFYGDGVNMATNKDIIKTNIAGGNWHYIVMVVDVANDEIRGYLDGADEDNHLDISSVTGDISNGGTAYFGTYGASSYFLGLLDSMMVFNDKLSEEEILWLRNESNGREILCGVRPLVGGSLARNSLIGKGLVT